MAFSYRNWLLPAGVIAGAFLGAAITARLITPSTTELENRISAALKNRETEIRENVRTECAQTTQLLLEDYARKREITLDIIAYDSERDEEVLIDLPNLFSKYENFQPESLSTSYLASKVGFTYRADLTTQNLRDGTREGPEFVFRVRSSLSASGEAYQSLTTSIYEAMIFPTTKVTVEEREGKIHSVWVEDYRQNTLIRFFRESSGNLSYDSGQLDEEDAKHLFDVVVAGYYEFKESQNISVQLRAYIPKIDFFLPIIH